MSRTESRSITAALNARPRYGEPYTNADGRVTQDEVDVLKRGEYTATQYEFRRLSFNGWLHDSLINIFLRAYVQEKVDGAHCFTSYFFNLLWNVNEEVEHGRYRGFGPQGTPPDTEEERGDIPLHQAIRTDSGKYRTWPMV